MENFGIHMYTDITFGHDAELQAAKKIRQYGGTKVMLVYGKGSIVRSGLYERVVNTLKTENLPFVELGGVTANPLLSYARKGLELAKREKVDFLLAAGGGSAVDTAKGIALGLANGPDFWEEFYLKAKTPPRMAPVGVISTIAAAGSECSRSSVLRDEENNIKMGFLHAVCRPTFALLNPELTYTLPAYQTAVGASDIFAHALERYFCPGESSIADGFSATVMRSVVKYSAIAIGEPQNYQARAELMLSAAFAHNDITGMGHGNIAMDGSCHTLERQIGGIFNTAHGEGLAVIMPAWLEYMARQGQFQKQAQLAHEVFGVDTGDDPLGCALEGVARMRKWLKGLKLASRLSEMGIDEKGAKLVVEHNAAFKGKKVGLYYPIDADDAAKIFASVL